MNKYFIEQINVSDNEYLITSIPFNSGDRISRGDIIISYESSKADFDGDSNEDGYIYYNPSLQLKKNYKIGYLLAVISEEPLDHLDEIFNEGSLSGKDSFQDTDKIITKKAKKLIDSHNIDVNIFDDEIISEEIILEYLSKTENHSFQDIEYYYSKSIDFKVRNGQKKLAIIGAGKAALQLLDTIFELKNIDPVVLYDNNSSIIGKTLLGIEIKQLSVETIIEDYNQRLYDEIIISFRGILQKEKGGLKYWIVIIFLWPMFFILLALLVIL